MWPIAFCVVVVVAAMAVVVVVVVVVVGFNTSDRTDKQTNELRGLYTDFPCIY